MLNTFSVVFATTKKNPSIIKKPVFRVSYERNERIFKTIAKAKLELIYYFNSKVKVTSEFAFLYQFLVIMISAVWI